MSVSKQRRNSCATCGKTAGTFTCRGCKENFCLRHTNEHREGLDKRMTEILHTHDQLKDSITGQTTEEFRHSLLQQIDQWEQKSIDKINRLANDTRQQLLSIVRDRADGLKEKMLQLTQQLNKARRDGEFFENELNDWSERLNKFQQYFTEQQRIQIHQDKNSTPFISRISLSDASDFTFTEPITGTEDDSDDETIDRKHYSDYPNLKEQDEHSSGEHSLRFKIQQYKPSNSIFFGIISKNCSQDLNPDENATFYGWTGNSRVYLAGVPKQNYNGYKSDIRTNDIFMLKMNCDQEMISLTNERTRQTHDLQVDITKCPLPWTPHVRFLVTPE